MISVNWQEKIRRRVQLSLSLVGFFLLTSCGGPAEPNGPAGGQENSPRPKDAPPREVSGRVIAFDGNPGGDIDRIEIISDTQSCWYHFPPHLARIVTGMARKNSMVMLRFRERKKNRPGQDNPAFDLLYLRSDDLHESFDLEGMPPPPPRPGQLTTIEGRPDSIYNNGKQHYFILAGKKIVLSPRSAEILLPIISGSHNVVVKGEQRDSSDGFISIDGLSMIRARQIRIDSINYIIE